MNTNRADGTRSVPPTILGVGAFVLLGLVVLTTPAWAQTDSGRGPGPQGGPVGPDQPVQPRVPVLVPRGAETPARQTPQQPQSPRPPFVLTPQEEAQVDGVLKQWEERNRKIETFDCQFKRWTYDVVFGLPNKPKFIELGVIKYAAPDRGLFRLDKEEKDGKEVAIDNARAEHWLCDGKSVFEYDPAKKQVIEHKLPPELRGKAIANSPLPFLFGSEAQKLKQRYFVRLVTPLDVQGQIWLEAYPRFQGDAANFHHAIFIITAPGMSPFALRIVQPNGKDYTVYQFFNVVVNDKFRMFQGDPFRPFTPWGWRMIPDDSQPPAPPSSPQARRPTNDIRR
jgi:TIGR03009 family protein